MSSNKLGGKIKMPKISLLYKIIVGVSIVVLLVIGAVAGYSYSNYKNSKKSTSAKSENNTNIVNLEKKSENNSEPQVKKSSTGICHEKGTTYYEKTANYTSYDSIEECLASGGRLPKK